MTDRSLRFFAQRAEAHALLVDLRVGGAAIIVHGFERTPPQRLGSVLAEASRFAYIGYEDVSDGDPGDVVDNPGAHAWVRLLLPFGEPDVLYMAVLDIRTKWLNHDNPAGVPVFDRVTKLVRRRLHRPTEVWSVKGGGRRIEHKVAYTAGARDLFDRGTPWMQFGVANIRFGPAQPPIS